MNEEIAGVRSLLVLIRKRQGKSFLGHVMDHTIEAAYTALLQPGDSAIDVGANRGRHTLPMARSVGAGGKVYAVEAATETLSKLREALKKSKIDAVQKIVSVFPVAVSDETGTADFTYLPTAGARSGLGSSDLKHEYPDARIETVKLERLDDLIPHDDRKIRFIKMDIEGAELKAMQGGVKTLDRCRPAIVFENGRHMERFGYTTRDVYHFMEQKQYLLYTPFGTRFDLEWFDGKGQPGQLFAIPQEFEKKIASLLQVAAFRAMVLAMPKPENAETAI